MADSLNQTVMTEKQFEAQSASQQRMLSEMQQVAEQRALTESLNPVAAPISGAEPRTEPSGQAPVVPAPPPVIPGVAAAPAQPEQPAVAVEQIDQLRIALLEARKSGDMAHLAALERLVGLPQKT
ncbi:hypothetical protein HY523_00140 [Candidatus Berkelbacteria bacterium]|nr:hypothetical protein [Candidatus Berkelbacteria bacterium]